MAQADEVLTVEARLIDNVSSVMKTIGKTTLDGLNGIVDGARRTTSALGNITDKFLNLKSIILGAALKKAFDATIGAAGKFETQMREVATLSQEMSDNIGQFSQEVLALSASSGQGLDVLTKSLYDSISAGIAAKDAMGFLTTATQLALGGATDTATAVDGLTTVINAYGLEASQASDVSDAFFVAMKFGKTTVAELAHSLGPLAPTAKAAGLSFAEMLGSVSALTKAGIQTKLAVTAMQGALVSINSLSPQVTEHLQSLGLASRVTGENGATFIDVLNNLSKASGGTLEGMLKLVPSIEGARAIMALTSKEGANYKEVMKLMGDRAGETAKAYSKFTDTFEFKSNQVKQSFNVAFIEMGNQLMPFFKQFADFLLEHMEKIKTGIAFAASVIIDAWNGVTFIFKAVSNSVIGVLSLIVAAVAKVVSAMPEFLLPKGWKQSLDEFSNLSFEVAVSSFEDVGKAATELADKGSSIVAMFDSTTTSVTKTATSVNDLTQAEKELLGITAKAAVADAEASTKREEQRKQLLATIEQLEKESMSRTHLGRLVLLDQEKQELLAQAEQFKLDESIIIQEMDAKILSEKMAHATMLRNIAKKGSEEEHKANLKAIEDAKRVAEARKAIRMEWMNTAQTVVSASEQILGAVIKNEKAQKKIALIASIIHGTLAIQKALASAPPPANIPAVIAASAMSAANVATIASQAFEKGGFPVGRNVNARLNEKGQESVLNAGATVAMGSGAINRLNAGRGGNTMTAQINYSPTITLGSNANQDVIGMLKNDKKSFANFIQEELIDKRFLTLQRG